MNTEVLGSMKNKNFSLFDFSAMLLNTKKEEG